MGMTLNLEFLKSIKLPKLKRGPSRTDICFYSPSTSVSYEYSSKTIRPTAELRDKATILSFIQLEDMLLESVEINKFLDDGDLYDAIELKVFDELGLEPSLEYKICYEPSESEQEGQETRKFNVYIVTYQAIKHRLSNISDKYIDFVFLPQVSIKSLFTKNFLSDSATFAFIYLYADSAYLCVYQNGVYTYSKSIRASIKALAEKFSEGLGERVSFEDFVRILLNADFRAKKPEYEVGFRGLIADFLSSVSDVLVHAKRVNQISGYEAIYISTEHGNIADIPQIAKEYFETPFKHFDFNLGIQTEGFVDMATKLMIFAYINDYDKYERLNFSIFQRPPPLIQRHAGKFMIVSTASLLLSFAYPLYNLTAAGVYYKYATQNARERLELLNLEKKEIEKNMDAAQKKQSELNQKKSAEEKKYSDTVAMLKELEQKREGQKGVSFEIADISSIAASSKVMLRDIEINATDTMLECSAKGPTLITGFSKKLWESGKSAVSTEKITKEDNGTKYIGKISIKGALGGI